ncbi:MAG: ArdC-like ssDNA-binding domain-containing protein [Gemmatimonadetes bacterium]|nr:ArdC-like ssDNA-binding domain-containing protein [Gemmatimonadota bacterium]MCY3943278.1 ArdC-like ssDNA-binding domain-containing protein [Gemmatimonadota bacterium]
MSARPVNPDFFKDLTARILAALEEGVVPWRRRWRSLTPTRYVGLPFTGTNNLVLSLAADVKGHRNPFWLTKAQGRRCGAKVLDGEKGTRVLRPLPFPVPDRAFPLMESYEVFNGEQFDRLPPRFRVDIKSPAPGPRGRIDIAEDFFAPVGAEIVPGGDRAVYNRSRGVRELAERPLDDRAWIVVYLDIVDIGPHPLVGAVGVDTGGTKRVLGLRHAGGDAADRAAAAEELLRDVVNRGVRPDRRRLVVTDGSTQLRDAAVAVFGPDTYVQACRLHREREVLSQVREKEDRDKARKALREAWVGGAGVGPRRLKELAERIERAGWEEATTRLRAGSGDLFTVDRFGLDSGLAGSLVTTGVIDSASSGLRRQICGVPSWGDGEGALAWAAASFLETERGFLKVRGHRRLQHLKDHLDQIEMPFG